MKRRLTLAVLTGIVFAMAACQARKDFPEPNIGYHTPSFNAVFGRLLVVPTDDPEKPVWVLRFGNSGDSYQGEVALTDLKKVPEFTRGYSGGEPVEIHGHLFTDQTKDAFNGRWYVVDSIQLWSGYRQ